MADDNLKGLSEFILARAFGKSRAGLRSGARSRLMQGGVFALAFLIGIATFIFGLVTFYLYLNQSLPALKAAALMTVILLATTLVLWLLAILLPRLMPAAAKEKKHTKKPPPDLTAALIGSAIEGISKHPLKAGVTAIAAGILVGYSPEVRALLLKFLSPEDEEDEPEA